jgi:hypothetical protein
VEKIMDFFIRILGKAGVPIASKQVQIAEKTKKRRKPRPKPKHKWILDHQGTCGTLD